MLRTRKDNPMKLYGHFWYSQSQKNVRTDHNNNPTFAQIVGRGVLDPVEYTEMRSMHIFPIKASGMWRDYVYLGFGWYHHSGYDKPRKRLSDYITIHSLLCFSIGWLICYLIMKLL